MKKYLALLLAMMMCFALVSCGGEVTDMEKAGAAAIAHSMEELIELINK